MASGRDFTGEYRHQIDDKGRLAVPSRMRDLLVGTVHVAQWLDTCLAILPPAEWDSLAERVAGLPVTDPRTRAFTRRLYGMAVEAVLDGQGRILLPANLREFAGLDREVYVIGARTHAEIWAPDRWDAEKAVLNDDASFASLVSGLGI